MGLKAGTDISVVGFDDISMAGWPLINVTTWVQPLTEMVELTLSMIKSQLEISGSEAVQHVLMGKLIIRGSTRSIR